jgi:cytochrome c nitrite reductase small subunit
VAGVVVGIALGVGAYTFVYARGASYLTNDPTACVNCHVMREQLDGWLASSHRAVAVCNDCHAPHDLVGKYATKAVNGFGTRWPSPPAVFTSRSRSDRAIVGSPRPPAGFFLDFVEAENSTGFHAPQEAARILGEAIDFARLGQLALRDRR